MKNLLLLSLSLFLSVFSAPAQEQDQAKPEAPPPEETPASSPEEFEGREGCFILRDLASGEEKVQGALCDTPLSPCSTFKIANALIGLDSGVMKSTAHRFAWDGSKRARSSWEREMDLAEAIKVSCVPCFQDLARSIGPERMAEYLGRFEYGNQDISGGITSFWLGNTLLITPRQQVGFLAKLYTNSLPIQTSSQSAVRRLLAQRKGKGWSWGGKTGSCQVEGTPPYGWFVGYVEHGETKAVFATLIQGEAADGPTARKTSIKLLQREGLIPKGEHPDKKPGRRGKVHQKKTGGKAGEATGKHPPEENPR